MVYIIVFTLRRDKQFREMARQPFPVEVRKRLYRDGLSYIYWEPVLPPELREYKSQLRLSMLLHVILFMAVILLLGI